MNEQRAEVFCNEYLAGDLVKTKNGYIFTYNDKYFNDKDKPAISISFPKSKKQFVSEFLFPFFFGLLSEGVNKEIQCRTLRIDEKDYFTRLIKTASTDTIGAITLKEIK
ncbi:MAG: HipA N-terminal domain-containing protein [Ignavibacteria bacterium]|nr:HipA N-terminal domain-containing protein [Ignavibacteria bacterium]